jgi:sterol O-acyltransferase
VYLVFLFQQELKKQLIDQMDVQLSSMMEEYIVGIEGVRVPQKYRSFLGDTQTGEEKKRKKLPCGALPEKEFVVRNSLLTDLFEINHIQTIYHIFIAILILLFMNTMVEDIVDKGRIDLEFTLILWAFGNLQTVLITWVS